MHESERVRQQEGGARASKQRKKWSWIPPPSSNTQLVLPLPTTHEPIQCGPVSMRSLPKESTEHFREGSENVHVYDYSSVVRSLIRADHASLLSFIKCLPKNCKNISAWSYRKASTSMRILNFRISAISAEERMNKAQNLENQRRLCANDFTQQTLKRHSTLDEW